jgi:hypothetical protein
MKFTKIFIIVLSLFNPKLSSKILIFTYAFNRPDFIELQYKTFKKFLKDDYKFVVFSDAKTALMHHAIKTMCNKYHITCVHVPQEIHDLPYLERPTTGFTSNYHNPSVRNCNVVQYSLNIAGFYHDDIVMLIDSDMFLIKEFSIRKYLENFAAASVVFPCNFWPSHVCAELHPNIPPFKYLWIGLVFLNMKTLPNKNTINFNCGYVYGNIPVDSGGYTAYYLKNNPSMMIRHLDRNNMKLLICENCKQKPIPVPPCTHNTSILKAIGLNQRAIEFAQSLRYWGRQGRAEEFLAHGHFLHYRGGTNYHNFSAEYHQEKTECFNNFLKSIIKDKAT